MRINETAYATGSFEKNDATSFMRELQVAAQGSKPRSIAHRPKSVSELMKLSGGTTKVET